MTLDDYKAFYNYEWQRGEQLQSAANTPISVVTVVGGGLILMGKGFDSPSPALSWLFWATAAVAAALVVCCVFYVVRSLHGYEYQRLPYASDLAAHFEALKEYYNSVGRPGGAAAAFEGYLTKRYIEATDRNAENNLRRTDYLHLANRFRIYALGAAAITAVPAGIVEKTRPAAAQEVRITNLRSDAGAIVEQWKAGGQCSGCGGRPSAGGRGAGATGGAGQPQAPHRP